ncbi:sulfotransferase family protein [Kiritimatiella glycovorans]|uniref:Sulfotransferase domain protein n=1 Tax=Kiritimatiella glycovorans TaxID=1307763 RepID=A0A0G3EI46_9BACT|nr:sulfotransferase [Kiritimatiella glycovorans]AKJ65112.1 Sulfotransferase domain protein [Kiritimatiella glycovorans]
MQPSIHQANIISRLLFGRAFRDQWVLPAGPGRLFSLLLRSSEFPARMPRESGPPDRPVFLVSLPRAGSSMLQDLLCSHRDAGYFTQMMHAFWPRFCGAEILRRRLGLDIRGERFIGDSVKISGGTPADPVQVWADWLELDPWSTEYCERHAEDFSEEDRARMYLDIRRCLWCFGPGKKRFFSKNPALLPHIDLLPRLFPGARIVYLVRDPRPAANSLIKLYRRCEEQRRGMSRRRRRRFPDRPFIPYPRLPRLTEYLREYGPEDIRTTAGLWRDAAFYVDERLRAVPEVMTLRYEDFLADPGEQVARLLDFCELPAAGASNPAFRSRLEEVGCIHHSNRGYGRFEEIEAICGEAMERLGYRK